MTRAPESRAHAGQLAEAAEFLRRHDRFLVVSHIHPDGDAVGSTCAVGLMLEQLGKSYTLINEGPIPAKFRFLPGAAGVVDYSAAPPSERFSAVIMVDCADFERSGDVRNLIAADAALLNIDHHPTNNRYGSVALVQEDAAATAEILFELGGQLGVEWVPELATCVYTGLLTDTGGFRYSNTSPKVMEIASQLLRYGVDGPMLAKELLERMTFAQIQLLKSALATLSFSDDRRIGWLTVSREQMERSGASHDDTEGLVNYPINIDGVEVGLLFKQVSDESVKVSMRSAGRVNVAAIAQSLGGGGHVRAAGCTVSGPLGEAAEKVLRLVEKETAR